MRNKLYYNFILERGLETIIHVFLVIFYYTKNLDLTFYHSQKAYYFYIEFIEQISDDNITFLQLSSRDATLFVYKKTIYELNNEYIKHINEPSIDEKNILNVVETYISIYKIIVQFLINHKNFKYEDKTKYIGLCCNYIEFINEMINKHKYKKNISQLIYLFVIKICDKELELNDFFKLLGEFIKKINIKKKLHENTIKNKINDLDMDIFNDNATYSDNIILKINEYIFTD
jgi:hypothetical protein